MASATDLRLGHVLDELRLGKVSDKKKLEDLNDLKAIFGGRHEADNLDQLSDAAYHRICETLFAVAIETRYKHFTKGTGTTAKVLSACADAIRLVVRAGVDKLKWKTTKAVIDHVIQTLPKNDGTFVEPMSLQYLQTLSTLLKKRSLVERLKAETWSDVIEFCLEGLKRYTGHSDEDTPQSFSGPSGRSASGLASNSGTRSSSATVQKHAPVGSVTRQSAEELLSCIQSLVLIGHATLLAKLDDISTVVMHMLRVLGTNVSQLHHLSLSVINAVLSFTRDDRVSFTQDVAQKAIPIMCRFWQGKALAKDEMLNSVRDEMLILFFSAHLHLESCIMMDNSTDLISDLEHLLGVLKSEYSKRIDRDQLQLDDIEISDLGSQFAETKPFGLVVYRLRSHSGCASERNWATLLMIGIIERLLITNDQNISSPPADIGQGAVDDKQLRKRQRVVQNPERLFGPLSSADDKVKLTGLQIIPFVVQDIQLPSPLIKQLFNLLCHCSVDKNPTISSWAFLALASCNYQSAISAIAADWTQLWRAGARALTFPGTCRAAAVQLHSMMATGLVRFRDLGEDVASIISASDISGPATLCDASMSLMMHLLHVNVAEAPGAGLVTCQHVIRWLFGHWHPADKSIAAQQANQVKPTKVVAILRTSLGLPQLPSANGSTEPGSPVAQAWQQHLQTQDVVRYLLLLDVVPKGLTIVHCPSCPVNSATDSVISLLDNSHFFSTRKLILEFLLAKCGVILESWKEDTTDRSVQMSTEPYRAALNAWIVISLLLPSYSDKRLPHGLLLDEHVQQLAQGLLGFAGDLNKPGNRGLFETLVQCIQPYLPSCQSDAFFHMPESSPQLLNICVLASNLLDQRRQKIEEQSSEPNTDMMDLDDEIITATSPAQIERQQVIIPRSELALRMSDVSFYLITTTRLLLLSSMSRTADSVRVPTSFVNHLIQMKHEEVLACRQLIQEILGSRLVFDALDAVRLLEYLGGTLSSTEFGSCEIAMLTCLDALTGFAPMWSNAQHSMAKSAGQLYEWFMGMISKDLASSASVRMGIANLLMVLMQTDGEYVPVGSTTQSPRTILFHLLAIGNTPVKFCIGNQLSKIFGLFTLDRHEMVFIDILEALPEDQENFEGIAFRLNVLAKLGSKWPPTLLRRCVYHIFEAASKIADCVNHAATCLSDIASALDIEDSQELFSLYAGQILYTWLEENALEDIQFVIFGFLSLRDLLESVQEEATAIMVLYGKEEAVERLADLLQLSGQELVTRSFPKVVAYAIAKDVTIRHPEERTCIRRVRKRLGADQYLQLVNKHLAEIVAIFFQAVHQGDTKSEVERYWDKNKDLNYAASIMRKVKSFGASDVELPVNQQPSFRSRYLAHQITYLFEKTPHDVAETYTPALVTFVARKLFNSIHPALGSLDACSKLRKLRILISLAGPSALEGYPLEMILHSVRPFINNAECIDDAIGIAQYLLDSGSAYLVGVPVFVAGILLSILGSLTVFLRSVRASTTQDSQYNLSKFKAEQFCTWIGVYASEYQSTSLGQSAIKFQSLMRSAQDLRSNGGGDNGPQENKFLSQLLEDERTKELLTGPSRKLALAGLCSDFQCPSSFRDDIFGEDSLAVKNAPVVWESCKNASASRQYMSWAARVLGRAFAASGHIHQELLQESSLSIMGSASSHAPTNSRLSIMRIVEELTLGDDQRAMSLAETAFRTIISSCTDAVSQDCKDNLSRSLLNASSWTPYEVPPSEVGDGTTFVEDPFNVDAILRPSWLRDFSITLTRLVPQDTLLDALIPILRDINDFPGKVFPLILHLVLSAEYTGSALARDKISNSMKEWFSNFLAVDKNNLKILLNSLLYLRTQPKNGEKTPADRFHWLELDLPKTAAAASHCGMFKTALLLLEESHSAPIKTSRRSSVKISSETPDIPSEALLTIFQNIDDPDSYYGVQQSATFNAILARLEYEKDGPKSLAFRGAQYDSHIRRQNPAATQDAQSLVAALDSLSLSGLGNSLLQSQQSIGVNVTSLDAIFQTARKLEQWDIPVPSVSNNDSVTLYKAFQAIHIATDRKMIVRAINEGLETTMTRLVKADLGANALHSSLQTLAALAEMDEVFCTLGSVQFEAVQSRFQTRSDWMRTGRFDDINQIISCRGTALSTLSQQDRLQGLLQLTSTDTRLVEVQIALLSAGLNRAHGALQESLSVATSLMDLIGPCQTLGLNIEAAVHSEAADALWDQGEMISSIGMLQALKTSLTFKSQNIPVGRSRLLSKIGHQVSVARLEKPDQIMESYLKPALKELKGKNIGDQAGQVYHRFAVFCDEQLHDPDGLEDLERQKQMTEAKKAEVDELKKTVPPNRANHEEAHSRFMKSQQDAIKWLNMDRGELERLQANRDEFLRQCLENYLLAMCASDEHDGNALRFLALWLKHSTLDVANNAVSNQLERVPSRKFAFLMNQLTSRLLDQSTKFQQLLFQLVLRICTEHPYHGMYSIYAGSSIKQLNGHDAVAQSRGRATTNVSERLKSQSSTTKIWEYISRINNQYCTLAAETSKEYQQGLKVLLKKSPAAAKLNQLLRTYPVPPPTMQMEIRSDCDYTRVPTMTKFDGPMAIASGVSRPKILTAIASNGLQYKQLVKGGNDDLRQDAIMEQVFAQVSELLKTDRSTRQRNLIIRTYKVLPLTAIAGIIEFVPDTRPLNDIVHPAHKLHFPKDMLLKEARQRIDDACKRRVSPKARIDVYRAVTAKVHPVMRYFFTETYIDPDEWFIRRLAYTRSTAAISILGHVLGIGDRHGHNILMDVKSGEVVHIDLGIAFEMGRILPIPETVPFRLTRDVVDGMGITKTEGVFRRCCEFTLQALRKEDLSIMSILDVLRYDPLHSWSMSPARLAKQQEQQDMALEMDRKVGQEAVHVPEKEDVNRPSEADRALAMVSKKLSKTLSVAATVNDLINQAVDENNLGLLFSGWAAYL